MVGQRQRQLLLDLLLGLLVCKPTSGLAPFVSVRPIWASRKAHQKSLWLFSKNRQNTDGEVGSGDNWIERAFPVDTGDNDNVAALKKVEDYNLGISGHSFGTGDLSKRMYDAIMDANGGGDGMDPELRKAFTLYAMDFTAKEAARAALKANGLEMAVEQDMEDEGMWGEVDSIQLLDPETNQPLDGIFETTEDAVDQWTPGQGFNFIVRQVPAKMRELTLEEILQALDPDGSLRSQAEEANWTMPEEDIISLQDLANDSVRRTNSAQRGTTTEAGAFRGLEKRGYRAIGRGSLSRDSVNSDGTENERTLMNVMDALVSHGALLVDLTDGGATYKDALKMLDLWKITDKFFRTMDGESPPVLPGMTPAIESCPSAKVGYAEYDNGSMKFFETRFGRDGGLYPEEAKEVLTVEEINALKSAFRTICEVGKDVSRIAVAAASMEAGAFDDIQNGNDVGPSLSGLSLESSGNNSGAKASQAATLLVDELIDDGTRLDTDQIKGTESSASMTPLRLCHYKDQPGPDEQDAHSSQREIFGAHTDSTFITAVPVASISGLEVYDEAEERWYRPELAARKHWEIEQEKRSGDPTAMKETIPALAEGEDDVELPWHCRYVVLLPGEFLQIATRNEVSAAVHRVVAARDQPPRLSAPILLRGRPGVKMNVERYLGQLHDALLQECNGMTIDQIHEAMQPSSFQ